ncbi:MAG: restriction endonuclease, partial [Acidobacteria bacterium]|nr:restriction endonuclease [Acidobacteriota bacterium]
MEGIPHSNKRKKDRTRNDKGIILEEVVAMLHDYEGVKVERNVKFSPKSGDKSRKIEIDVLLTSYVAGYPIRIAIQCKNYEKRISREQIGAFKDSLDDVGIPYQHGIVVSVHGFQSGAIKRAKELGIRTRELKGLTKDRLAAEIQEAFQFFIYLLPIVTEISVTNEIQKDKFGGVLSMAFFDKNLFFRGLALDLIVNQWRQDNIPTLLGEYNLELKVPSGWYQLFENKPAKVFSIEATVKL